ncbi:nitroreductase family deazaflavin-dependent oxidoreductase [Gordonia aurantiaca]|uniref:nitroreductase family deazaflavin-dependent oxidoreductase n=1 Tax=Gordonia sp. B21 TaxID=3151852 RepID=UPI003263CC2F
MSFWKWYQRKVNERTVERIRTKSGTMWGMDMVILRTKGRKSGRPRETPLCWFPHDGGWLVVASGGGKGTPDWYANLTAHPESVEIERHGQQPVPVKPAVLTGEERRAAWEKVVTAQPRYAKYQKKASREYPVVKLQAA